MEEVFAQRWSVLIKRVFVTLEALVCNLSCLFPPFIWRHGQTKETGTAVDMVLISVTTRENKRNTIVETVQTVNEINIMNWINSATTSGSLQAALFARIIFLCCHIH